VDTGTAVVGGSILSFDVVVATTEGGQ